jgi:hypothetical protein
VAEASRRTHCRFPIRYEDGVAALLPHLSPLRNLAKIHRLRSLAELTAGQTDAALIDVHESLQLAKLIRDEPLLISFLVRGAIVGISIQPVWEGINSHRWNESQLATIQADFEGMNLFESFKETLQCERLEAYQAICWARDRPSGFFDLISGGDIPSDGKLRWLDRSIPSGWFYQNQLGADRFYTVSFFPTIDFEAGRINPKAATAAVRAVETTRTGPYNVLCKVFVGAMDAAARRAALSQTDVEEAEVACALERYRLAHGKLPDTLDMLVPEFLSACHWM